MSVRSVLSNLTNAGSAHDVSSVLKAKPADKNNQGGALGTEDENPSLDTLALVDELSSKSSDYVLNNARMMFLERIMAVKKMTMSEADVSMESESVVQSRFLDSIKNFQRESEEYEAAFSDLEATKVSSNDTSKPSQKSVLYSAEYLQSEVKQSEDVLAKLLEQQSKMDNVLAEKRIKRDQAKVSLDLSVEETMRKSTAAVQAIGGKFRMKNSAEEKEFASAIQKVQDQRDNAEALLEGLRVLTGIQSVRVPNEMVRVHSNRLSSNNFNSSKSVKDQLVLPVTVEIGDIVAVLTLDEALRLTSIDVTSGEIELDGKDANRDKRQSVGVCNNTTSDVLSQIMEDAKALPTPQDLRYAVFSLGCVQKSPLILRTHVSELRKKCIVRSTGPLAAEFTLSVGVTVSLSVHPCYPNVPAGVTADSIVGVGGWSATEVELIRTVANARCFSTVMEMFDFLLSPGAFGR